MTAAQDVFIALPASCHWTKQVHKCAWNGILIVATNLISAAIVGLDYLGR